MNSQCRECPWRDLATVPAYAVAHARENPNGFMCHTRCIPCPGPVLALRPQPKERTP